ncbi:hypothetical protein NX059_009354 [Plenodomus lindquistii]|nr:hypothetical protein NX059_009354 [Plenodomus lindquistii]
MDRANGAVKRGVEVDKNVIAELPHRTARQLDVNTTGNISGVVAKPENVSRTDALPHVPSQTYHLDNITSPLVPVQAGSSYDILDVNLRFPNTHSAAKKGIPKPASPSTDADVDPPAAGVAEYASSTSSKETNFASEITTLASSSSSVPSTNCDRTAEKNARTIGGTKSRHNESMTTTSGDDVNSQPPVEVTKLWYLGALKHWKSYQEETSEYQKSKEYIQACHDAESLLLAPLKTLHPSAKTSDNGAQQLKDFVQEEILEVVNMVYNEVLQSPTKQQSCDDIDMPAITFLAGSCDDDLGSDSCTWNPTWALRAISGDGEEDTKIVGHMEYMDGEPGALTRAIKDSTKMSWGSLRCVLGDIAQSMLMGGLRFGFVATSDELMLVGLAVESRTHTVIERQPDQFPMERCITLSTEPEIWYSDPIKFTDRWDPEKKSLTVRLALLRFFHLAMTYECRVSEGTEPSLKYIEKTKAGEKYVPQFRFMYRVAR